MHDGMRIAKKIKNRMEIPFDLSALQSIFGDSFSPPDLQRIMEDLKQNDDISMFTVSGYSVGFVVSGKVYKCKIVNDSPIRVFIKKL